MIDLKQGHILGGRYRIIREIGRGGFGVTFLAEDTQRPGNPHCVVKQFKPTATDPRTLKAGKVLFDREAQTLEKLGIHNQIPQLLAHLKENQQFYLVQEYIPGQDINQELSSGKQLSETVVTKLLHDILEVLDFVHKQNVIHRDIKPSNIRRRQSDGKIVLIDFGAVKEISTQVINSQGKTSFTIAIGTPGYMPSEQTNGCPDFSSDVYAVGMIGIQALTGVPPTSLTKNSNSEFAWHHLVEVSPELANVLDTMVRYDFRQRYRRAELALQALKTIFQPTKSHAEVNKSSQSKIVPQKFFIPGVIATGILGIGIAIFSMTNTSQTEAIEFANYKNNELGIKIKYPENWQRQDIENLLTQEVVTFISPKQNPRDKFQEKVTISVKDYSGTLDASEADIIKGIIDSSEAGNVMNTSATTVAYKPGYQIVYTGQKKDQNLNLKNLKVWTLRGEKVYIVTYTAQVEDYERFVQTAQKMIKSFEFTSEQS